MIAFSPSPLLLLVAVYANISIPSGPGMQVFVRSLNGVICSGGDIMICSITCASDDDQDDIIEEDTRDENANEPFSRQRDVTHKSNKEMDDGIIMTVSFYFLNRHQQL